MPDSESGSGHRGHAPALQYGRLTVALKTLGSVEQSAVTHTHTASRIGHIVCFIVTHWAITRTASAPSFHPECKELF